MGRTMADFYPDAAERAKLRSILDELDHVTNYELERQRADGTRFWLDAHFHNIIYEGEEAIFAVVLDISERKRRSEELEERVRQRTADLEKANEQIKVIAERVPVPIAITSKATGKVMYANDHLANLYGLASKDDLVGGSMKKFYVNLEDRDRVQAILKEQGHVSNFELKLKKVDGATLWVDAYFHSILYEGEEATFGALSDISERKQRSEDLERRVRERTAELEAARDGALEADQAKNRFLGNVSHELRNPLNHISGYCSLLEQAAAQKGHDYFLSDLREIRTSAEDLLKLVKDILFLTKMGADKVRVEPKEVPVAEFVRDLAHAMAPEAEKNGNRLEVHGEENAGTMWTDPGRLRQILTNLLSNACKFTERGTITLRVDREKHQDHDWLAFAVADTGIGMTPEEMSRLFEPFVQANDSIGTKYGGTGLSLALSKGFCHLLGGKITVESTPGKGSRFTARLPARLSLDNAGAGSPAKAAREAQALPGPPQTAHSPSAANLVLVIDDDPKVHELMHRFVGIEGFQISSAFTGEEGLKLAKKAHPAVITLDTLMPGLNGWEVLKRLKGDKSTAHIPVIMLTVVDDKTKAYELGASEFVTKPVEWKLVAAILGKYCTARPGSSPAPLAKRPKSQASKKPAKRSSGGRPKQTGGKVVAPKARKQTNKSRG